MPIGPLLAAASDAAARMRERRGDVTPTSRNLLLLFNTTRMVPGPPSTGVASGAPVLKNTGGRKDPTPRVHAGSHSQCLVAPQTFFPVW